MALIFALAIIACTFLGGLFAIRFKDKLHLILGFSAGAVVGVALFDLLPESFDLSQTNYPIRTITLFIALGFAVYMLLDRFFSARCTGHECENPDHHDGKFGAITLALHSFLDGIGIGLAFKVSPAIGIVVAVAVLTHDFSDGINTVNMILKDKGDKKTALMWLILDAIAPALGIISTFFFSVSAPILGLLLAIFAGFFLYIGASDLVPESHHRHPKFLTSIMTILGMIIIYAVIFFS